MAIEIVTSPVKDIWFTSDSHFGHSAFLNFVDENGKKIRPFSTVTEMDECMIERWNSVVKTSDRVYHLGDIGFGPNITNILSKLHGSKRLILGNHDDIKSNLINYFKKVTMWRIFKEYNFVATHVPIHDGSLYNVKFNLHGHIHKSLVMTSDGNGGTKPDPRYINVCVERTNYTPVHLDEIYAIITKNTLELHE